MGNGLLAHWRFGFARRGLMGALLLAVPVAMAAALGFSGGFGAVPELPTFASGPVTEASGPSRASSRLDDILTTPAPASGAGSEASQPGVAEVRGSEGGTDDGGPSGAEAPSADSPSGSQGDSLAPAPQTPSLPTQDPAGTVESLVDDVEQTAGGLLGGR